jgi:hypothetical protein
MTTKPPTPQGVSRLLAKAGFERSVFTASQGDDGSVAVTYVFAGSGFCYSDRARDEAVHALQHYRGTLTAAGYRAVRDDRMRLIVTAGEDTR